MKKNNFLLLFIFFIIGLLTYIVINLNTQDIDDKIDLTTNWIVNSQNENGLFKYSYNISDDSYRDSNNIVRQVGTFYSLIMAYNYYNDSNKSELLNSIYLFKDGIEEHIKVSYTKTNVKIAYIEYDYTSMVNTNALYILSLIEMKKAGLELSQKDLDILELMVAGIKDLAVDSGGFLYIYFLENEKNRIDYYGSGEAMFALSSYYYYIDNDESLFQFTNNNFENFYLHLDELDFDNNYKSFFLWGLLYLKMNYQITGDDKWKDYMVLMVNKALEYRKNNVDCNNFGCLDIPFTAGEYAYLEGVASVYDIIIDDNNILKENLEEYVDMTLKNIYKMQVKSHFDLFLKNKKIYFIDIDKVKGGFCDFKPCENLRIDYAQHSLILFIYASLSENIT